MLLHLLSDFYSIWCILFDSVCCCCCCWWRLVSFFIYLVHLLSTRSISSIYRSTASTHHGFVTVLFSLVHWASDVSKLKCFPSVSQPAPPPFSHLLTDCSVSFDSIFRHANNKHRKKLFSHTLLVHWCFSAPLFLSIFFLFIIELTIHDNKVK